jgi:hypothetical protein
MHELRRSILEASSPEQAIAVDAKLYEAAIGGDVTAMKVWLEFHVGRPVQQVELSATDGEPVQVNIGAIVGILNRVLGDDPDRRAMFTTEYKKLLQANGGASGAESSVES